MLESLSILLLLTFDTNAAGIKPYIRREAPTILDAVKPHASETTKTKVSFLDRFHM